MTELTVTGTGSVGELQPGWSVSQQATAVAIGESDGSVGSASIAAERTSTSEFVGGQALALVHPELGTWDGAVANVRVDGLTAKLETVGVSQPLVASATAKPFMAGTPILDFAFPVTDYGYPQGMAVDSSGNVYVYSQLPTTPAPATSYITKWSADGKFSALLTDSLPGNGGNNGETGAAITSTFFMALDPTEQFLYFKRDSANLIQKITTTGTYVTSFATGGAGNGQIAIGGPGGMAIAANGNLYIADWGNNRVDVLDATGTYVTKWGTVGAGTGQFVNQTLTDLALDSSANVYTLEGKTTERVQKFTSAGVYVSSFTLPAEVSYANSIAVNGDGTEVYVQCNRTVGGSPVPMIYVFDSAGNTLTSFPGGGNLDSSLRTISGGLHHKNGKLYFRTFTAGTEYLPRGGNRISVATPYPTLQAAFAYYMNFVVPSMTLNYLATSNPVIALPGWTGDVWARVKDLCAAYGVEWSVVDGVATVRDVGSTTLELENNTRVALTAASQGGSRNLAIKYQNTASGDNLTMFTATAIETVNVLETRSATYQTSSHPLTLNVPTLTDLTVATAGTYHVEDVNGLDVPAASWTYYGGSVTPALGDVPGQIRITFQGPRGIIPGYTAPFSLAYGIGTAREPRLIITGRGVTVTPKTIVVGTGADPEQAATTIGATIDNFAISTPTQAYSRGSWAQDLATGTDTIISFTIDNNRLAGFGLDQGSLVRYNDSIYRVTDISYGNLTASITAHRHVTYRDVKQAVATTFAEWNANNPTLTFAAWNALYPTQTFAQFNALYPKLTNAQHKAIWSGYSNADTKVKPLRST